MSEKLKQNTEQREVLLLEEHSEQPPQPGEVVKTVEKSEKSVEAEVESARADVAETVAENKSSNPLEDLKASEQATEEPTPSHVGSELETATLRRELKNLQRKEKPASRTLSKIIHQPVIRVVSETTGKSVSRPSGLLGGGLMAFVGSSIYLYMANNMGFSYNYLVVFLLLVGGFALGVVIELLVYAATASRRSNH